MKIGQKEQSHMMETIIKQKQDEGFIKGYLTAKLGLDWENIPYEERKEIECEAIIERTKRENIC